jgi:hypothetical protein
MISILQEDFFCSVERQDEMLKIVGSREMIVACIRTIAVELEKGGWVIQPSF